MGSGVNAYDSYLLNNISSVDGLQTNTIGPLPGTVLKPEETQSYEIGLDLRTMHNRLNFDITYYKTNTINQRISVAAPFGSGYTQYIVNAGDIENKGIEAMVQAIPVESKNFKWLTSINFTKNKNEVLKLYDGLQDGTFFLTAAGVNNYAMVIREGGEFGDIFGRRFKRDDQGKIMVSDDGKPVPEDGGLAYVGNPNPDFMLGFSNHLTYKNFNLNFLVDGRFGGEVMSITQAMIDELGVSQATADARNSGSVPVNATAEMDPQLFYQTVGGRAGITEYYVYDATNVRLREVSLGYTLPASLVSKWGPVKSVKFSLVGRNLFFFKNNAPFDPDISMSTGTGLQGVDVFSLPSTRSFGFNISLSL